MVKTEHIHKFETLTKEKVMLRQHKDKLKTISGYDILKQRQCACGKLETYDLIRRVA